MDLAGKESKFLPVRKLPESWRPSMNLFKLIRISAMSWAAIYGNYFIFFKSLTIHLLKNLPKNQFK